jgi:transcription antitermination factor NusG
VIQPGISSGQFGSSVSLTAANDRYVWLAGYTTPRHEKNVARHLGVREIEHFLPLYKEVRRWKNGCTVPVEFPVFPSYVFVRAERERSTRLLEVPGLLAFAGVGRGGTPILESEIEWLRQELPKRKFEPHPYLIAGSKVRIAEGALAGATGILIRRKGSFRVVLSVELIRQSVAVEVDMSEVELLQ